MFLEARRIKTADEILLLTHACSMVDAAYEELYRVRCAPASARTSASASSPRPCSTSARSTSKASTPSPASAARRTRTSTPTGIIRPGDPAFFDILHSYNGYRTCYYRTFQVGSASPAQRDAYKICREYIDRAIALVKPGVTTADICAVWPAATEFGFADEMAAFALQYGHGVGLSIWERPIFSRMISFDHPEVLEEGMVFALETYWPAADGWSASRIEEEVVVTADGCEVITRFPAEELLVCGTRYWTIDSPLPTLREIAVAPQHRAPGGAGDEPDRRARRTAARARPARPIRPGPRRRRHRPRHPAAAVPLPAGDPPAREARSTTCSCRTSSRARATSRSAWRRPPPAFGVALRPDDYTFATYRGHGHTLARGVPPGPIIAEMLGRGTGLLGGKGGSMHLTSVEHGMMGSYAIVGAHLCIANGAAWSARLPRHRPGRRGASSATAPPTSAPSTRRSTSPRCTSCRSIFVCENNLYMEYTAIGDVTAVRHPAADRAAAYGLEPIVVDGNDADAVYLVAHGAPSGAPGPATGRR